MSNIAIIPCRGGSKGIPMKNLQLVNGVPLVVRTISACLNAGMDQVFVSTDDQTISAYAVAAGAQIIPRPKEIAEDTSSTDAVLIHSLEILLESGCSKDDNLFLLQATTPFTRKETVLNAMQILERNPDCGVFTASTWHGFVWSVNQGIAIPYHHDHLHRNRRQDLDPQILETGGVYGASIRSFQKSRVRFVDPLHPVIVGRIESTEIDTWEDLSFCNRISMAPEQRKQGAVKVVFTDFDGVMTDNRIYQLEGSENGALINRSDGVAVNQFKSHNIPVIVLTGETGGPAFGRAEKLGISCVYSENKLGAIVQYCQENSILFTEIAYVGNDLNDLGPLATCGWTFVPSDAHPHVAKFASRILHSKGGEGVLREISDFLLV